MCTFPADDIQINEKSIWFINFNASHGIKKLFPDVRHKEPNNNDEGTCEFISVEIINTFAALAEGNKHLLDEEHDEWSHHWDY